MAWPGNIFSKTIAIFKIVVSKIILNFPLYGMYHRVKFDNTRMKFKTTKLCMKISTTLYLGTVLCQHTCNFTELPIKVHWVVIFKSAYVYTCRVKAKCAHLSKARTPSNDADTVSTESWQPYCHDNVVVMTTGWNYMLTMYILCSGESSP